MSKCCARVEDGSTFIHSRTHPRLPSMCLVPPLIPVSSERFVVLDHAHRTLVQVQPIGDDQVSNPSYEHCFCLTLLENHQGRMMERLMKAPSQ